MTLKSIVMSSACCLGVLALSPLAHAAGLDAKLDATPRSIVETSTVAQTVSGQGQETRQVAKEATPFDRNVSTPNGRLPANGTQRMVSTQAMQLDFVAKSTAAHAEMTGHGKPAEEPKGKSGGGAAAAQGGSSNPSVALVSNNDREMKLVASAAKAKQETQNPGKPMDEPTKSGSGMGGGSGAKGGSQNPVAAQLDTGARSTTVVGASMKAKSEKVNGDKPSETPRASSSSSVRSPSHSGGHGGGRFAQERSSAMSPGFRGNPGERTSSHCNGRSMCF